MLNYKILLGNQLVDIKHPTAVRTNSPHSAIRGGFSMNGGIQTPTAILPNSPVNLNNSTVTVNTQPTSGTVNPLLKCALNLHLIGTSFAPKMC